MVEDVVEGLVVDAVEGIDVVVVEGIVVIVVDGEDPSLHTADSSPRLANENLFSTKTLALSDRSATPVGVPVPG